MGKSMIEVLEMQEQLQKLINRGYKNFIDILLSNEAKAYTKKGRLNKSGCVRLLNEQTGKNISVKELEQILEECKAILTEGEEDEE